MYILIIARGCPSRKYKTYGIFEYDQAKSLVNSGCKVVYVAIDLRSIRRWRKWGVEKINRDGIDVYTINIPLGRVPNSIMQKTGEVALKKLYKIIFAEHGKPDILHAHFYNMANMGAKLKKEVNIPFVITEHFSGMMNPKIDEKVVSIATSAYKEADAIIGVSSALVNKLEKEFEYPISYIPNIVDTELFKPQLNEKKDTFEFISVGLLNNRKRMKFMVEVFNKVFHNMENVTLTIFGEGEDRRAIEDIIRKNNSKNKVILKGLCSRLEVSSILNKADCFVLVSEFETFGVVYIEALSAGVPVIATKCGGPEGFINKKNGLLVDVDNNEQLANAMKYMYEKGNNFDRNLIAKETRDKFSPSTISKELVQIYKKLIN